MKFDFDPVKLEDRIYDCLEKVHVFAARHLTKWIGKAWRWQSRRPLGLRFAVGFGLMALVMAFGWYLMHGAWVEKCSPDPTFTRYLETAGYLAYARALAWAAVGAGGLCVLSAGLAFVRIRLTFRIFQVAWSAMFVVGVCIFRWTVRAADIFNLSDHKSFDAVMRDALWTNSFVIGLFLLVIPLTLLLALLTVAARRHYGLKTFPIGGVDTGGQIIENLRTGGKDPRWRSSIYWTLFIFFMILIAPYLLFVWGWETPYLLPAGGGEMLKQQVVQVKKQKKKKKKKLTVNPFSPYILERMNIDDVKTVEELEVESRDTYVATTTRGGGKGKGTGGWAAGFGNGKIRFIRLKYHGGDLDQDMGKGADYNLLLKFNEWTGIKIAKDTEFREVIRLKFFPHKKSPPFVFLTGKGGISLSESEVKVLRDYCLVEGGMLFIDNGGGGFGGAVRSMLRRVFPGKALVDIPNDDAIFQRPYVFPDGAPPFWHHDGYRALGIRDEGRWCVFYHPGDMNDAWRDDHSGATKEVADQSYKLGVNIMFYAFNQYYHRHYENGEEEEEGKK